MAERELTGKHVLIGFVAAFAVIITVNLIMAYSATSTFPGLVEKNTFIASQKFNQRLRAQKALGWTVKASHERDTLIVSITDRDGKPVEVEAIKAVVGRPTHRRDDHEPTLSFNGKTYVAPMKLNFGNWDVQLTATAKNGTEFSQLMILDVE